MNVIIISFAVKINMYSEYIDFSVNWSCIFLELSFYAFILDQPELSGCKFIVKEC